MEKVLKHHRLFPWQAQALDLICKKKKTDCSKELRMAVSFYLSNFNLRNIKNHDNEIYHFNARNVFEKRKKNIK